MPKQQELGQIALDFPSPDQCYTMHKRKGMLVAISA